ncbi:MAG TPA: hypothetical protein VK757_06245 [Candidatus Acidoferrum sp.]|nr:hypothetical protein [Candidatus Acidoferrum sp.]
MKRATYLILVGILTAGPATAKWRQQPGTPVAASSSGSTTAEASRGSGVQAGNASSGAASAQHNDNTAAGTSLSADSSASAGKSGAQVESGAVNSTAASAKNSREAMSAWGGSAANSTMNATLVHPLDVNKNKPGDPVKARTTHASQSPDGTPLPKGTELVGHVTQTQSRTRNQSESDLGIVFDKAVLKNGQEVPINGTIQAVAAAQNSASAVDDFGDGGATAGGGLAAGGSAGPGRAGLVGGGGGALGAGGTLSGVGRSVGTATAPVGNVGSSARPTVGTTTGAMGSTAGTVGSTAGAAGTMTQGVTGGLNAAGELTSNSHGVFNMQSLNLATAATSASSATGAAQGSLLRSETQNVHLDSGTQLLVSATNAAQLQASK